MEATCTRSSNGSIIKQEPKPRPILRLPWKLEIEIGLWESNINTVVTNEKLRSWFEVGGMLVALGNQGPTMEDFIL